MPPSPGDPQWQRRSPNLLEAVSRKFDGPCNVDSIGDTTFDKSNNIIGNRPSLKNALPTDSDDMYIACADVGQAQKDVGTLPEQGADLIEHEIRVLLLY